MKLHKLTYVNHKTGWNIKDLQFGSLSLFVGASGVGKTQILRAILDLGKIARGESFNGIAWELEFEEDDKKYVWTGEFDVSQEEEDFLFGDKSHYPMRRERLIDEAAGKDLFYRDSSKLFYHNNPTVKLDPTKSAIELLKEESDISPVNEAFRKITLLDMRETDTIRIRPSLWDLEKTDLSLQDIKRLRLYNPFDRLYLIQKNSPHKFTEIESTFCSVFTLVKKIDFDLHRLGDTKFVPTLKIKEDKVDSWIDQLNISNGMMRTLAQIITLALAEDGDVILIDEFENGLGVNCIEDLAEMAVEPEVNVQIIMTSHHPYIINAIPYKDWRIVSRRGSDVRVNTADELGIGNGSKHKAFMQLVQTTEYTTGQS